jgi:hypothetical protein
MRSLRGTERKPRLGPSPARHPQPRAGLAAQRSDKAGRQWTELRRRAWQRSGRARRHDTSAPYSTTFDTTTEVLKQIINSTLSSDYLAYAGYTRYSRLVVNGVPAGARVTVKCKGRKCPVKSFRSTKAGSVKLARFIKKKLRAGTTLTIRVTKPGTIGKQFVIKIRKGKRPTVKVTQIA